MSDLYERIAQLCEKRGINITILCKESGASRGSLTDLKVGRKQSLSTATLSKIASYFDVSTDYLLGNEEKRAPEIGHDDFSYALYNEAQELTEENKKSCLKWQGFSSSSRKRNAGKARLDGIKRTAKSQKAQRLTKKNVTGIIKQRALRQAVSPKWLGFYKKNRHLPGWRFLLFTMIVTVNRPMCNVIRIASPPFGWCG